jgi:hypothetical protein
MDLKILNANSPIWKVQSKTANNHICWKLAMIMKQNWRW